jgi:hypothetical protein
LGREWDLILHPSTLSSHSFLTIDQTLTPSKGLGDISTGVLLISTSSLTSLLHDFDSFNFILHLPTTEAPIGRRGRWKKTHLQEEIDGTEPHPKYHRFVVY